MNVEFYAYTKYPLRMKTKRSIFRDIWTQKAYALRCLLKEPLKPIPAQEETKPMLKEHIARSNGEKQY